MGLVILLELWLMWWSFVLVDDVVFWECVWLLVVFECCYWLNWYMYKLLVLDVF